MNRLYMLLTLLVVGLGLYLFNSRCEKPTTLEVLTAQLKCAENFDIEAFKVEACQEIYAQPKCEFQVEDNGVVKMMLLDKVNACAKNSLKERNKCIDNYEDLK